MKIYVSVACWRISEEIRAAVAPAGMMGPDPGFTGTMNATAESVLYSADEMVRYSNPSSPSPRLDCTEAVFALSCRLRLAMVS